MCFEGRQAGTATDWQRLALGGPSPKSKVLDHLFLHGLLFFLSYSPSFLHAAHCFGGEREKTLRSFAVQHS